MKKKLVNWINKHKVLSFVICIFLLSFTIPLSLEFLIFRNEFASALDNSDWSSFFGSFLGGIIGGAGTLVAVYITTKETRKIQLDAQKNKLYDDRKKFVDEIIVYMSRYITDINSYLWGCRESERLNSDLTQLMRDSSTIISDLRLVNDKLVKVDPNDTDSIIRLSMEKDSYDTEKAVVDKKIEDKQNEIQNNKVNRTIACECYYILKVHLEPINEAQFVIKQLEYVHNGLQGRLASEFFPETEKLMNVTIEFVNQYLKKNS
ncbi:hypothetical protein [Anaerosporobacter faecicola]|uniref:hypothetical protein n=1 Tax=Anaerosporobacter faecicola TaxID=2718714 RepID=UPI00143C06F4|nr:hypothetical protein [Anaerosporobacter faecicola]